MNLDARRCDPLLGWAEFSRDDTMASQEENPGISPAMLPVQRALDSNSLVSDSHLKHLQEPGRANHARQRLISKFSARQRTNSGSRDGLARREWFCSECRCLFSSRSNYTRHLREKKDGKRHRCPQCGDCFTRQDYLRSHTCRQKLGKGRMVEHRLVSRTHSV